MTTLFASGALSNTASNWGLTSGASDGSVPIAGDDVIFDANSISMALDANFAFATLISTGFTATLTQGAFTITHSGIFEWDGGTFAGGSVAIFSNGAMTVSSGTFTATSNTIICTANLNINETAATYLHNNGLISVNGNSDCVFVGDPTLYGFKFNGAGNVTVTGDVLCEQHVFCVNYNVLNGTGLISFEGNLISGISPVTNSTIVFSATKATGDQRIQSTVAECFIPNLILNKAAGTLIMDDDIAVGTILNTSGTFDANGKLVHFVREKTLDLSDMDFYDLEFDSAGNFTISSDVICTNDFLLTSANAWLGAAFTVFVGGDFTWLDATVVVQTIGFTFNGTGDQIVSTVGGADVSGTVTIDKPVSGSVILTNAIVLNGTGQDLIIAAGILDLAGFDLTVDDVFTITDTLRLKGNETIITGSTVIGGASTIIYYDNAVTAVVTALATAFFNLIFGASKVHEFATGVGNGISVAGALASDGATGTKSILRSVADAAVDWELNLTGTSSLTDNVDVKRSDASAGLEVSAAGSQDSGDNTNWNFDSAPGGMLGIGHNRKIGAGDITGLNKQAHGLIGSIGPVVTTIFVKNADGTQVTNADGTDITT